MRLNNCPYQALYRVVVYIEEKSYVTYVMIMVLYYITVVYNNMM